ncbi:hypothetical protein [Paradesulfitobacterium ferrireducens]|uniref:hypothetical protein n=1 Tax=Paradesulfitobacterium ferrireducens TaxID=2816476 RepID=UPI001F2992BD|nr:hypothetical protein [Paradesulfitobacterium ferrireducens]
MALAKESVIMREVMNATDVRKEWGNFIDSVVRYKPSVIKRNRDYMAAMSLEQLDFVLSPYRFNLAYEKEADGSYSGSLRELDLLANASNLEELKTEIIEELVEYANEYMNEFQKYYNAPNRKSHFPYVMRVVIQKDKEALRGLIDA